MSVFTVDSVVSLRDALSYAHDGDEIQLAAGNYSGVLIQNLHFASNVTISSADPTQSALITDLTVKNSSGLTFSNIEFSSDLAILGSSKAAKPDPYPFRVTNSDSITFSHDSFHGSLDDNPANDRNGLFLDRSTNIAITESTFQQLGFGIVHSLSSSVYIVGNEFHDIRSDGVHGSSSFVNVSGNYFHDFHPAPGDHPDAIQFFTESPITAPHDIVAADNLIVRGGGGAIEGIFLRLPDSSTLAFANVAITHNTLVGTMYDGITVLGGQHVSIADNTLVSLGDMSTRIWVGNSDDVTVTDNQASAFIYGSSVSQNLNPASTNTHIAVSGSQVLSAVSDLGQAAVAQFLNGHPGGPFGLTALPAAVVTAPVDPAPVFSSWAASTASGNFSSYSAEPLMATNLDAGVVSSHPVGSGLFAGHFAESGGGQGWIFA